LVKIAIDILFLVVSAGGEAGSDDFNLGQFFRMTAPRAGNPHVLMVRKRII
jgi:hypothetical protein